MGPNGPSASPLHTRLLTISPISGARAASFSWSRPERGVSRTPPFPLSLTHTQLIDKSYRLYFPNRFMLRRASCRLQGDTWAQASLVPHPGCGNSFLQSTSSPFVSLKSALGMVAKRSFFFFFKRDAIHINPLFKILQKLFRFTKSQVSTMKYKTRPLP